jgi:crotonobetainyl-CoA:carnitine CoA-transferase CaiB-like acyl-CoA transferase
VTNSVPPPQGRLSLLDGVTVVASSQFLIGPAAVQYLGDMGADVIKVEPPAGAWERRWSGADAFLGDVSVFFLATHRNTRSVCLNLKNRAGRAAAHRLISHADVFVENYRPGVMDRLGLSYDRLRELNPRLIYASASGFGARGPHRELPGQDLLLQAVAGLASITGRRGDPPTPVGAPVVDQHGAALLAMGILGAIVHRQRTGDGQRIEVSMFDAALDLQTEPFVYFLNGAEVTRPEEAIASAFHPAPYGIYPTQDGYLALSLSPLSDVLRVMGALSQAERFRSGESAYWDREEAWRALARVIGSRSTAEWISVLRPQGIWCSPVNDYEMMMSDPSVQNLVPVIEIEHPRAGKVRLLRHPVRYSSGEPVIRYLPPDRGADTEAVLRNLGYTDAEIARLRTTGAVR